MVEMEVDIMDREYENMINALKNVGEKSMSDSTWSLKEYSETIKKMYDKYGEERVKKDLGIE